MTRPKSVNLAIVLATIALVVGFISTFVNWQFMAPQVGILKTVFLVIAHTLSFSALLFLIARRHNWARIVLSILIIVSIPAFTSSFLMQFSILSQSAHVIQFVLYLSCVVLLFLGTSRNWFKALHRA